MKINEQKRQSQKNLDRLLKKIATYKHKNDIAEVDIVLKSLPIYHCVPASNIINVLKEQEIKVKNQVIRGEHTNNSTDYFQGFENHLSMSVGKPWIEYGPYAFAYGLEHVDERSLVFSEDPWLWGSSKFQDNVLTKDDFVKYARELLLKNMYRLTKKRYIRLPWKTNLHKLAERNFGSWEIKQASNLRLLDAEEFFVWTNLDAWLYSLLMILGNRLIVFLLVIMAVSLLVGGFLL
jgi:hypothetical protein